MKRAFALLNFALGALSRRRGRAIAMGVGLFFFVTLYASVLFLGGSLRAEWERAARSTPDLTMQRLVSGRPALVDPQIALKIGEIPGVRSVEPRLWGYLYVAPFSANVTIIAKDARVLSHDALFGRDVQHPGECVLGSTLAEALGTRVDDDISLSAHGTSVVLKVVGIITSESDLVSADLVRTDISDARILLHVDAPFVTDLAIDLTTPDESAVITQKILALFADARVIDKKLVRRTYSLTFDKRGGLLAAMLLPALAALLLLAWDRMTGIGPDERREIGILKAIGFTTSEVLAARLWEVGIVVFFSTTLGLAAAYFYVFAFGAPGIGDALFGWSVLHPALRLTPAVSMSDFFGILLMIATPFLATSLVPAWHASLTDPDEAMRGGA